MAGGVNGTSSSGDSLTVFDALGFDTGAPDGYNQHEDVTDSPYGRTYTTMKEVRELLLEVPGSTRGSVLYGEGTSTLQELSNLSPINVMAYSSANTSKGDGAYSISVEGNFSLGNRGKEADVATLVIRPALFGTATTTTPGDYTPGNIYNNYKNVRGSISLYTHSVNGINETTVFSKGTTASFDQAIGIGNPIDVDWKSSASRFGLDSSRFNDNGDFLNEYVAYNYLKMAIGDFDGDGLDEIAVYIPELDVYNDSKARVEVYDSTPRGGGDTYVWSLAASIPLQLTDSEGNMPGTAIDGRVPNMVSLTAGDFNRDGIEDLAISYGYLSSDVNVNGFTYSYDHHATIRWGATYDASNASYMLSTSLDFPLVTGSGESLVRTTFTTGDADGDGYDELVLGGSVLTDKIDSRYVAVYEWTGSGFSRSIEQNFDIFETYEGTSERVHGYIANERTYYSTVYAPANMAVGRFLGTGTSPIIYMDSLFIGYSAEGELEILDMMKNSSLRLFNNTSDHHYVEYGARAADITGGGTDILVVQAHYISDIPNGSTVEASFGTSKAMNKDRDMYSTTAIVTMSQDTTQTEQERVYSLETFRNVYSTNAREPLRFALPDCDNNDTVVMEYTGEHYYTYADPEILAILASPPHFSDLEAVADNQMMESTTSYSTSTGTGSGTSHTHGFSAGAYVSYEADVSIFGVTLFSYEMESEINNSFTWDFQQTRTLEYEISYGTQVGQDSVVLYAMPVETYVYIVHTPGGESQTLTVNVPYEPSVEVVSLERYNEVYEMYPDVLPQIDGKVLTHTVGSPSSYPSSEDSLPTPRLQTLTYPGDPMRIGYGQVVTSQTIAMTSEEENSFNWEIDISFKAGVGSGGLTAGITLGTTHGAGKVSLSTSGAAYSAEMQALPTVAQDYGYSFNWRMVGFLYQWQYPVVTYIVTSVTQPPLLPDNFGADDEDTTEDALVLEWDFTGTATGFNIYKYYVTTAGADYYILDTVSLDDFASINPDGSHHFRYTDSGLSAGTEYRYKIQTIGSGQPYLSIPSAELVTYTKPANAPVLGVTSTLLKAYPDGAVASTVIIENQDAIGNARLHYQWERIDAMGVWTTLTSQTDRTLAIQYGTESDAGTYRCRVTAMLDSAAVTVYSPKVVVEFERRTAGFGDVTVDSRNSTITATVTGTDSLSTPTGSVVFTLNAGSTEKSYTVELDNGTATLSGINPGDGVYSVTCYYSGNRVFYPAEYDPAEPVFYAQGVSGSSEQKFLSVESSYGYGDPLNITVYTVDSQGNVTGSEPADLSGVMFHLNSAK